MLKPVAKKGAKPTVKPVLESDVVGPPEGVKSSDRESNGREQKQPSSWLLWQSLAQSAGFLFRRFVVVAMCVVSLCNIPGIYLAADRSSQVYVGPDFARLIWRIIPLSEIIAIIYI